MGAAERHANVPSTGERVISRSRGHGLVSTVEATRELCGDELVSTLLTRFPQAFHRALEESPDWVPTEFVVTWYELVSEALGGDERRLAAITTRAVDLGFGRVRKLLLGIATPHWVLRKGEELWRGEQSAGRMTAYAVEPNHARVTLTDHPFLDSAVMRRAMVTSMAYTLTLTGAKSVTAEVAGAVGEPLVLTLTWKD